MALIFSLTKELSMKIWSHNVSYFPSEKQSASEDFIIPIAIERLGCAVEPNSSQYCTMKSRQGSFLETLSSPEHAH